MHRFRELFTPEPQPAAFVPCPVAVGWHPGVVEIYRLAAERTREQLADRRPARIPAFSHN